MTKQTLIKIDPKKTFKINCDFDVYGFKEKSEYVPEIDINYIFDEEITKSILAGFSFNARVLVQGMHGTGKSTHIEQIAARLNWPCMRINFDSQITRMDLVGKDIIKLVDGKQITEFKEGILPFALKNNIALILDEYDAIRTDVSFVMQRLLEEEGKFSLFEENEIISPTQYFRIFATSNTIGSGDDLGIYHGTNLINQAQMDRWNIVGALNYLDEKQELEILTKKIDYLKNNKNIAKSMIKLANLTRESFKNGDISNIISLRTLISWGKNIEIFGQIKTAFILSFLNKIIEDEKPIINEFYQRVFGEDIL
ncbi:MAG: AAA family ATPase [Rickettsiales bacterium]|nr:AAA family ATPase [Rickettsiales bacterium]